MGGIGSGRLEKNTSTRQIQQTLTEAALHSVKLVRDAVRGTDAKGRKVKPLSGSKVKLCELAINHAIGTPRQKVDLRVEEVLTLRDLARLAFEEVKQLPKPDTANLAENVIEGEYQEVAQDAVFED